MQDKFEIFMWLKKIIWVLQESLFDNKISYHDSLQRPTGNQKHGLETSPILISSEEQQAILRNSCNLDQGMGKQMGRGDIASTVGIINCG